MKSKLNTLFLILIIVGIMLISYGIVSGATTAFSIDNNGFSFLKDMNYLQLF